MSGSRKVVKTAKIMPCTDEWGHVIRTGKKSAIWDYILNHPKKELMRRDKNGRTVMFDAVVHGNLDIIRILLERGFAITEIDRKTGANALHIAASCGWVHIVKYLVNTIDMDVNAADKDGKTPLFYALQSLFRENSKTHRRTSDKSQHEIAIFLLSRGAKFDKSLRDLHEKILYFETELLKYIQLVSRTNVPELLPITREFVDFILSDLKLYQETLGMPAPFYIPHLNFAAIARSPEFQKAKIPAVFGWRAYDWERPNVGRIPNQQYPTMLSKSELKCLVYDLTELCPLLINTNDCHIDEIRQLISNIYTSIMINNTTSMNPVCIELCALESGCVFEDFGDEEIATNISEISEVIKFLSAEIERRRGLSRKELKSEPPVVAIIGDFAQILEVDKSLLADIQNIMMFGNNVMIYTIAFGCRGKRELSSGTRAYFPSVMTFRTENGGDSNRYIGHSCGAHLRQYEVFLNYLGCVKPVHILIPDEKDFID